MDLVERFRRVRDDSERFVGRVGKLCLPPYEADLVFPLCVTPENADRVVRLIRGTLPATYAESLADTVARVGEGDLLNPAFRNSWPGQRLGGEIDARYLTGFKALKERLSRPEGNEPSAAAGRSAEPTEPAP